MIVKELDIVSNTWKLVSVTKVSPYGVISVKYY